AASAVPGVAADLRAGQAERVAQRIRQKCARLDVEMVGLAVDREGYFHILALQFAADNQIDEGWPVVLEHLCDSPLDLLGPLDTHARDAHRGSQRGEVDRRVAQVEAMWELMHLDAELLLPVLQNVELQQLVAMVIADHELRVDAVVRGRPERL